MVTDVNLLVIEKHTVNSLDSVIGSLARLVVDESIAFRSALFVCSNFAG